MRFSWHDMLIISPLACGGEGLGFFFDKKLYPAPLLDFSLSRAMNCNAMCVSNITPETQLVSKNAVIPPRIEIPLSKSEKEEHQRERPWRLNCQRPPVKSDGRFRLGTS